MGNDHIHRVFDGRGPRAIFVNGNEIPCVVWADTKRGVVFYKLRRDDLYIRELKGVVTVKFLSGECDG